MEDPPLNISLWECFSGAARTLRSANLMKAAFSKSFLMACGKQFEDRNEGSSKLATKNEPVKDRRTYHRWEDSKFLQCSLNQLIEIRFPRAALALALPRS
jgi:hypothetical protein